MTSHEIAAAAADLATVEALRERVRALEADNAGLLEAFEERHTCANCGGKGEHWIDLNGDADCDVCDCWVRADHVLHHEDHPGAALLAELEAARALKNALDEIDHEPVGAYEVTWSSMPEPCESCVEVREIAARALATYDAVVKARQ
jgi:hypothetical protein